MGWLDLLSSGKKERKKEKKKERATQPVYYVANKRPFFLFIYFIYLKSDPRVFHSLRP